MLLDDRGEVFADGDASLGCVDNLAGLGLGGGEFGRRGLDTRLGEEGDERCGQDLHLHFPAGGELFVVLAVVVPEHLPRDGDGGHEPVSQVEPERRVASVVGQCIFEREAFGAEFLAELCDASPGCGEHVHPGLLYFLVDHSLLLVHEAFLGLLDDESSGGLAGDFADDQLCGLVAEGGFVDVLWQLVELWRERSEYVIHGDELAVDLHDARGDDLIGAEGLGCLARRDERSGRWLGRDGRGRPGRRDRRGRRLWANVGYGHGGDNGFDFSQAWLPLWRVHELGEVDWFFDGLRRRDRRGRGFWRYGDGRGGKGDSDGLGRRRSRDRDAGRLALDGASRRGRRRRFGEGDVGVLRRRLGHRYGFGLIGPGKLLPGAAHKPSRQRDGCGDGNDVLGIHSHVIILFPRRRASSFNTPSQRQPDLPGVNALPFSLAVVGLAPSEFKTLQAGSGVEGHVKGNGKLIIRRRVDLPEVIPEHRLIDCGPCAAGPSVQLPAGVVAQTCERDWGVPDAAGGRELHHLGRIHPDPHRAGLEQCALGYGHGKRSQGDSAGISILCQPRAGS